MLHKRLDEFFEVVRNSFCTHEGLSIDIDEGLFTAYHYLAKAKQNGGMVYIIGNGGSAGIASHFHTDLLKNLEVPSSTLFDSNVLTCVGNDYGYEHVFSAPLKTLMKEEDVLVAISSSGKSLNIINAALVAKKKNAKVITFSGFSQNNPLRLTGDLNFYLEKSDYGLVESGHFFLLHTIVDLWKGGAFSLSDVESILAGSTHAP